MRIHFFSLFLFPFGYLFQNLKTYMFLKFHQVTKSIYIIKVYWISLWIDYLAARMFYKSIKPGVCDRSAKDAYSIKAPQRPYLYLFRGLCLLCSGLCFSFEHCSFSPYVFKENLFGIFQLPHLHQIITFCFLDGQTKRETSLNLTSNLATRNNFLNKIR